MTLATKAAVSWRTLEKIAIVLGNGFNSSKWCTTGRPISYFSLFPESSILLFKGCPCVVGFHLLHQAVAKLSMSRIKFLRNKRGLLVKQMRRDVAMLLESGQETIARIRVEHVIRDQNIMAANEIIVLF